ncbi:MAG: hypothetical protein QW240_07405 [Candidatus Caldarchaeum sp.]
MTRKEKWTLPVVYVPRFPWNELKSLIEVVYEVVEFGDFTVVFFWFHWSHDLPVSREPEYEPLALAYCRGMPKMVFHRPHNKLRYDKPVLLGRRAVVYVSRIGHAFAADRLGVLRRSLTPFAYTKIGRKRFQKLLRQGQPPENFRVWKNVDFRSWVLEQLSRPEIVKSIKDDEGHGLLRYVWHMLKASRCAGKGDLNGLFQNLVKAYQSMPACLRTSYLGVYLLKNAYGTKKMIANGASTSPEDNQYMRDKFLGILMETFSATVEALRLKDDERKQYINEIQMTIDSIKNT